MRVLVVLLGSTLALPGFASGRPPAHRRSETRVVPRPPRTAAPPSPHILFLNRNGGLYTPGALDDSSTNVSTIPLQASSIAAFSKGDTAWQQVLTCVRGMFAPFNIRVTDVDPGLTRHIEGVIGGQSQNLGLSAGIGGTSPITGDCSPIETSIVFTFAELYGDDMQAVCEVTANQVAHSFGLDNEFYCPDAMSYLTGCGAKAFRDHDAPCGELGQRACACGRTTQNSVQLLLTLLGAPDTVPPQVRVRAPANGRTVPPGFTITTEASDDRALVLGELYVDGALRLSATTPPFVFQVPADVPTGSHPFEVRVYDAGGNMAAASITANVQPECSQASACDDGNPCTDDACNADARCEHVDNTEPCDDGDACTVDDTCERGACVAGPVADCDDGDACTDDACTPASGCTNTATDCNDDDACTDDACVADTGCVSTHQPGVPGVDCELSKLLAPDVCDADPLGGLAGPMKRGVGRARQLLAAATTAHKPAQARKKVLAAQRALAALQPKVATAARRGKLSDACAGILDDLLSAGQTALGDLPF